MADITVDSAVASAAEVRGIFGPYWVDKNEGVIVYADSTAQLYFAWTYDGGINWTLSNLDSGVDAKKISVWFDQETPGDSGELIHIAYINTSPANGSKELKYMTFNVNTAVKGTIRTIRSDLSSSGFESFNRVAITKTRDGNLILAFQDNSDTATYRSTDGGANWTAIADVFEAADSRDDVLLFPANTGDDADAIATHWDSSANAFSVKMYDQSANTWTETAVFTGTSENLNYYTHDGAIRHSDGKLLVAIWNEYDSATADLVTYEITPDSIASPTVTAKTDVVSNLAESACVALAIDQRNDEVYVAYIKGGTWNDTGDVVYKKSDDDMGTWGSEQAYSEATADDIRAVSGPRSISRAGGNFQFAFHNDDLSDIFVNRVNQVEVTGITSVGSAYAAIDSRGNGIYGPYWTDENTGYIIYANSSQHLIYRKTTDGGLTWGSEVTVYNSNIVHHVDVWFDQETPDDTGDKLHITWQMSDPSGTDYTQYRSLDTSTDTLGSIINVATITVVSVCYTAITKSRNGNLYIAFETDAEVGFYRSTDGGANWTSRTSVFEDATQDDSCRLWPANTGDDADVVAFYYDESAGEYSVKMYDDSANTWTETSVDSTGVGTTHNDSHKHDYDGVIRHSDGHLLVVYHSDPDSTGDDIRAVDINPNSIASPAITAKTNYETNLAESWRVSVMIDQNTDDIWVAALRGGTIYTDVNMHYRKSDDGMTTWESVVLLTEEADDHRLTSGGRSINTNGGWIMFGYYDDDDTTVYMSTGKAIPIAATASGGTETAVVDPISVTFTIPSVTATYDQVESASVSPVNVTASIPAVTGSYDQVESAGVSQIDATFTIPSVSASSDTTSVAGVNPVDATFTIPSVAASYDAVISATVPVVNAVFSVPGVTGSANSNATAVVDPIAALFTLPPVTPTLHDQASVLPVDISFTIPSVTASEDSQATANVSPVDVSFTIPSVTGQSESVRTADVSPIGVNFTLPSVSAAYDALVSASVPVVDVSFTLPTVQALADNTVPLWYTENSPDWYTKVR